MCRDDITFPSSMHALIRYDLDGTQTQKLSSDIATEDDTGVLLVKFSDDAWIP